MVRIQEQDFGVFIKMQMVVQYTLQVKLQRMLSELMTDIYRKQQRGQKFPLKWLPVPKRRI